MHNYDNFDEALIPNEYRIHFPTETKQIQKIINKDLLKIKRISLTHRVYTFHVLICVEITLHRLFIKIKILCM